MVLRVGLFWAICVCGAVPAAGQHVVRFETTAGSFDMVLNPTNNPRLQGHVDNMIAYVRDHRYDTSWINRAGETQTGEPFVLQMGAFHSHTKRPPMTVDSTRPVSAFDPIPGAPAGLLGLSNTVGTVALALPGGSAGTNPNGGTSSFFINLRNNIELNTNFAVFAAIPDMTLVNQIMALPQVDLRPTFGVGDNLLYQDVPLHENGQQVFIKRAFMLTDAMSIDRAMFGVQSVMALSATGAGESAGAGGASAPLQSAVAVPEPASIMMLLLGVLCLSGRRRRSG